MRLAPDCQLELDQLINSIALTEGRIAFQMLTELCDFHSLSVLVFVMCLIFLQFVTPVYCTKLDLRPKIFTEKYMSQDMFTSF